MFTLARLMGHGSLQMTMRYTHLFEDAAAKASKKEIAAKEMEYHAEAIHENCITCHKAYNKKNKTKAAPQACTKCHPKKKK